MTPITVYQRRSSPFICCLLQVLAELLRKGPIEVEHAGADHGQARGSDEPPAQRPVEDPRRQLGLVVPLAAPLVRVEHELGAEEREPAVETGTRHVRDPFRRALALARLELPSEHGENESPDRVARQAHRERGQEDAAERAPRDFVQGTRPVFQLAAAADRDVQGQDRDEAEGEPFGHEPGACQALRPRARRGFLRRLLGVCGRAHSTEIPAQATFDACTRQSYPLTRGNARRCRTTPASSARHRRRARPPRPGRAPGRAAGADQRRFRDRHGGRPHARRDAQRARRALCRRTRGGGGAERADPGGRRLRGAHRRRAPPDRARRRRPGRRSQRAAPRERDQEPPWGASRLRGRGPGRPASGHARSPRVHSRGRRPAPGRGEHGVDRHRPRAGLRGRARGPNPSRAPRARDRRCTRVPRARRAACRASESDA